MIYNPVFGESEPEIEEYTEEDSRTSWHDLEWLRHGHLSYVPEFQLVYCLTRYVATLGDARYLETPPGLQDWLEDAGIKLTARQRDWGWNLVNRMLFFMGESHSDLVWKAQRSQFAGSKVRGNSWLSRQRCHTVSIVNFKRDPRSNELHKRLMNLVVIPPTLEIVERRVYKDGLVELSIALQQERPHKGAILRRRDFIGPFNWEGIKKRTPPKLRPRINKLEIKVDRVRRYYGDSEKDILYLKEKGRESLDGEPGEDDYDGEPGLPLSELRATNVLYLDASTDVARCRRRWKAAEGDKDKQKEYQVEREKKLCHNPETGVLKVFVGERIRYKKRNPKTGMLEVFKEDVVRTQEKEEEEYVDLADPVIEERLEVSPPGTCHRCGWETRGWICWYCRTEEDNHNEEFLYPTRRNNLPNPAVKERRVIVPEAKRRPKSKTEVPSDREAFFSCWSRDFIPKPSQVWLRLAPNRSEWRNWWRRELLHLSPPLATLQFLRDVFEGDYTTMENVDGGPEQVLSRVEEALSPESKNVRKRSHQVAEEIINRYGNPRKATDFIGYIPMDRFLWPCTQTNLAKKLATSNAAITRSMDTLRRVLPNMEAPALLLVSRAVSIAVNNESVNNVSVCSYPLFGNPSEIEPTRPMKSSYPPPDRRWWNVSGMITVLYETREERRRWALKELEIPPRLTESDTRWLEESWPKCQCGKESVVKMTSGRYYCGQDWKA